MTKKQTPFQELSLLSRFLFDAVMEDDETCRAMFEIILGRELGKFTHTSAEKEFRKSPLFRGVCQDVCAADEDTSLILGDGMTRIFLNTRGTNDKEVSKELVDFLHYVETSGSSEPPDSDSPRIRKIYEQICKVRANERLEVEYMQAWEEVAYARRDGIEIGRSEGIELGRSEGQKKKSDEITLKMLQRGLPDEDILDMTGISEKHLRALKEMALANV